MLPRKVQLQWTLLKKGYIKTIRNLQFLDNSVDHSNWTFYGYKEQIYQEVMHHKHHIFSQSLHKISYVSQNWRTRQNLIAQYCKLDFAMVYETLTY